MVDYWYYTGDAGNNEAVQEAIVHQAGDQWNFEPANQTTGLVSQLLSTSQPTL